MGYDFNTKKLSEVNLQYISVTAKNREEAEAIESAIKKEIETKVNCCFYDNE